jgi:AcrR family transcriptional regulator
MKENRKTKYTRTVIKDSFFELLKDKPFGRITVKEITEHADINRATFYAHYRDCNDLMREVEKEMAQHVIEAVEQLYKETDYQNDVVDALFDTLRKHKEMCMWFMDDQSTGYGKKLICDYAMHKCIPVWRERREISQEQAEWFFTYIYNGAFAFLKAWYDEGFSGDWNQKKQLFGEIVRSNLLFIYRE